MSKPMIIQDEKYIIRHHDLLVRLELVTTGVTKKTRTQLRSFFHGSQSILV